MFRQNKSLKLSLRSTTPRLHCSFGDIQLLPFPRLVFSFRISSLLSNSGCCLDILQSEQVWAGAAGFPNKQGSEAWEGQRAEIWLPLALLVRTELWKYQCTTKFDLRKVIWGKTFTYPQCSRDPCLPFRPDSRWLRISVILATKQNHLGICIPESTTP